VIDGTGEVKIHFVQSSIEGVMTLRIVEFLTEAY
jgi:hypothetical protein